MLKRPASLLVMLSVGHLLLISAQVQSGSGMPVLQATAFGAFAKVQGAMAAVADAGGNAWSHYVALSGAARENEDLKRRIVELEAALQTEQARTGRVRLLEQTLAVRDALTVPNVTARVIAGSPAPGSKMITIDRGTDDGVLADMPVIAASGVVGRVYGTPSRSAAQVQLLASQGAGAGVRLEPSGAHAVVRGSATTDVLTLDYLGAQVAVSPGEKVVTSGTDTIYPQGYLVGTIAYADPPGPKRRITVKPAVDFSSVELVLVLRTGATGSAGATGSTGATGSAGAAGSAGSTGAAGSAGAR